MLRTFAPFLWPALVLAAACAGDGPTGPTTEITTSQASAASPFRPAGGTCATRFAVDVSSPPLSLTITGTCQLKHLGRATLIATQSVDLSTGHIANTTTYTAANGDILISTFDGQVISPPGPDVVFTGTESYQGGTGRFAGATGTSQLTGTATLAGLTGAGQYTTSGSISY